MRHKILLAAGIAFTLFLGPINNVAYADFEKQRFFRVSPFEGHIVFCAPQTPPVSVEVLPGGVEIATFINIGNIWLTGHPLVDGVEENRVVAKFDPTSPVTTANVKGKVDVAAVHGIWRFRQRLMISPDGVSGIGIGLGFGDLRGKLMIFRSGDVEVIENSPCEVPVGATLKGKVISFGWFT